MNVLWSVVVQGYLQISIAVRHRTVPTCINITYDEDNDQIHKLGKK